MNVLGKHLAETYPIALLVFFRSFFALITSGLMASRTASLRPRQGRRQSGKLIVRAFVWLGMIACSFAAYHLLPVADAAAVGFSAPVIVAALAGLVLKEKVGTGDWLAILIGLLGVLLILRPSGDLLHPGFFFALGNAVLYAVGALLVRDLCRTEDSTVIVFYCCLVATLASGLLLPLSWRLPSPPDLVLLSLLGILGAGAQVLSTEALRHAPAPLIAPFSYSGLIWAMLFGYLIWDDLPDRLGLLGAALIAFAGVYLSLTGRPQGAGGQ